MMDTDGGGGTRGVRRTRLGTTRTRISRTRISCAEISRIGAAGALALFAALTQAGTGTVLAQSETADAALAVETFYEAVRAADAGALETVVAPDATIRLVDLGFDMTGEEFIDSMETWEEVAADMTMRVKPDPDISDTVDTVVRIVCYAFPSNDSLTRETNTLRDGMIIGSVQESLGDSCEEF